MQGYGAVAYILEQNVEMGRGDEIFLFIDMQDEMHTMLLGAWYFQGKLSRVDFSYFLSMLDVSGIHNQTFHRLKLYLFYKPIAISSNEDSKPLLSTGDSKPLLKQ